jgi:hypothetical protein
MRIRAKVVFSVVFLVVMALASMASMATAATATGDGVEALLDLLSSKGVISADDAAGLRSKSGSPSAMNLKAVLELLQSKGQQGGG